MTMIEMLALNEWLVAVHCPNAASFQCWQARAPMWRGLQSASGACEGTHLLMIRPTLLLLASELCASSWHMARELRCTRQTETVCNTESGWPLDTELKDRLSARASSDRC